jgi:plasmid stabilization system protein ParE
MKSVLLSDEARADVLEAFEFYEGRREGLGVRFRDHVDFAMQRIATAPGRYPIVYRDLRRRLVERFPYAVFYKVYPDFVFVVAVMHGRQSPDIWKLRAEGSEPESR